MDQRWLGIGRLRINKVERWIPGRSGKGSDKNGAAWPNSKVLDPSICIFGEFIDKFSR